MVLRCGDEVRLTRLVTDAEWATYFMNVTDTIDDFGLRGECGVPVIAVEDVVAPNPHMGLTNVSALIETARLVGYLQAVYEVVLVPPGGHGKAPLQTYPEALVGPRETSGTGRRRHLRSAWDVAGASAGAGRVAAAVQDATNPRPA